MADRRRVSRDPVYYGATLAYNARASTFTCVVRNFSEYGAKIEISAALTLPDEVDFALDRKKIFGKARLVWRDETAAGLKFQDLQHKNDDASLDWRRRLTASERTNQRLRTRIEQLTSD
jgi:hypothetical protein